MIAVAPTKLGGTETFAAELSRQLAARGWQSVLCFLGEPTPTVSGALRAPNIDLEVLPDSYRNTVATARHFSRLVRKYRPRIVHLHFVGFVSPYPWLAALSGVERVYFTDQSGLLPEDRSPAWKRLATRLVNRPMTGVIAVSDDGRTRMVRTGLVPERRVHRIYNGIDTSRVAPTTTAGIDFRARHGIPKERVLVMQVGSFIKRKRVADVLRAAVTVTERQPRAHFALVGDGPCRDELVGLARDLGLDSRVSWIGPLEDPVGEGAFAAADVACLLSDAEACPFVILEAIASGCPVVATRVGGVPELVLHDETGYLVSRRDHAAAAEAIERLVVSAELRGSLGAAGRVRAETMFDVRATVGELIALYGLG